ncbi:MAG: DM13 domain-containing protein [Acidimicrobiia bacterium]|nr:DM13 domain-containing protein [Acidimicrobiia bacterium]
MTNAAPDRPDGASTRGVFARIRSKWKWAVAAGVVLVGATAWLAFGYFGIHTLFIDDEANEAAPVFTSGAGASGLPSDDISEATTAEMNEVAAAVDMPAEVNVDETEPAMAADAPEIVTLAEGTFVDRSHPSEGRAVVLNDGTEQRFLRFEEFATDNGPDLNVYLTRADADADAGAFGRAGDFVDLGDLTGNIGPQNYEIPADVDLAEFDTVVIWCVRFGVAFGAADLMPTTPAS